MSAATLRSLQTVAFIPARGGSKRLPAKNIRPLDGRPLLTHAIELARAVDDIDRCVVSTDDGDIAAIARAAGAEVVARPAELSGDDATTASAACHLLETMKRAGDTPSILVTLQPNCPLRSPTLVTQALALFRVHRPDTVVSISPVPAKQGTLRNGVFAPSYRPGTRSQELEAVYVENGLVYVSDAETVLATADLFTPRLRGLVCEGILAHGDIDTEGDFVVTERLYHALGDWPRVTVGRDWEQA
ncbi:MAG TPA: acylneuraminate cytidylyltransferase family protein [Gemmatimonadales bacterium]|nr:acylneuraminate cytidylyltransferase family protein [Gemmatimonadales bacterium]